MDKLHLILFQKLLIHIFRWIYGDLYALVRLYFLFSAAFTGAMPQLPLYVLLPALALVFVVFDIAFTRLIGLYMRRVHRANRKEETL